jgi:aminoglycoside phosphotransferase (APT) family kinase protein
LLALRRPTRRGTDDAGNRGTSRRDAAHMNEPGPLLAAGRDADVYEYGDGAVLRRSREGRSLLLEARTLEFLHAHGYPVPKVLEVSDDGADLVMERIDGPTMVDAVGRRPWTLRHSARELADLHVRLHELEAPPYLAPAPVGTGSTLLHMDLHPLNVMMGRSGPVVIDWTGARVGDPLVDVTMAWVLMAVGEVPRSGLRSALVTWARGQLVAEFLASFDRPALVDRLRDVVEFKVKDPHMSHKEVDAMWALVAREEAGR